MKGRILVSPVGKVNEEIMQMIVRFAGEMFGLEAVMYTSFPEPDYAFDETRGQYSSTLILQNLARVCPRNAARFLAITTCDLFIPMITFVYGQAQLSGRVGLVSLARLSQEFYGLSPNKELGIRRARKEIAHELGHTFGLVHCRDRSCLMSLSTEVQQIDLKSDDFCGSCWLVLDEELRKLGKETKKKTVLELHR